MDSKQIDPAALDRARKALARFDQRAAELLALTNFEEPSCPKCGRVIYCGVNKLCSDNECGLKNAQR